MADHGTITKNFTTISVSTTGDTVTTARRFCRFKNLGANIVSVSDATTPTAAVTAGSQTSVVAVPSTGQADYIILAPYTTYYVRAVSSATLCALEEIPASRVDF